MSTAENTILGTLKFLSNFSTQCFKDWPDFVAWLQANAEIVLPASGVTNVLVSNLQPQVNQTNFIWFRLDGDGNFIGIFVYSGGAWVQQFPPPHAIFHTYGDSRSPDPGYALVSTSIPGFTPSMVTQLQNQWLYDPTNTYYVIFDTVFVGT